MDQYQNEVLTQAEAGIAKMDAAYTAADFPTKIKLKPERDKIYEAWAQARRKLLEGNVNLGESDVAEMKAIGAEISKAAQGQQMVLAAAKLTVFLGKLAT